MSASVQFWDLVKATPTTLSLDTPARSGVLSQSTTHNEVRLLQSQYELLLDNLLDRLPKCMKDLPKRILDLGAGDGSYSLTLASQGAHVVANESSQEKLEIFAKRIENGEAPSKNVGLCFESLSRMPSYGEGFDLVIATDSLPFIHPHHLQATLEKIHACLNPDGLFIGSLITIDGTPTEKEPLMQIKVPFYSGGNSFMKQLFLHAKFSIVHMRACTSNSLSPGYRGERALFFFILKKSPPKS